MARKQFYGITYPFTDDGLNNYLFDLNTNELDSCRSRLQHILFTPKGQRIREPEFGTDLIKYIYDQNDELTWSAVEQNCKDTVSRWLPDVKVNKIEIAQDQNNPTDIFVKSEFTVTINHQQFNDTLITKL